MSPVALHDLAPETVDLGGGHLAEVGIERVAGFELLAVDQQSARTGQALAVFVEVAKELEVTIAEDGRAVVLLVVKAGHVVVDELGRGRVVADDDEAGRNRNVGLLPEVERFGVVAVEGLQRIDEFDGKRERIKVRHRAAVALGHSLADALPELAQHGHIAARHVVGDRYARQLDDAALDGVHERKVAHRPGKERALGVTRAAQEKWRGGEVDHAPQSEPAVDGL